VCGYRLASFFSPEKTWSAGSSAPQSIKVGCGFAFWQSPGTSRLSVTHVSQPSSQKNSDMDNPLRYRAGTRIRVHGDCRGDPHGLAIGSTGRIVERYDGKPHDGNADMWREDYSPYYRAEIDGRADTVLLWPEEIERI
jgi:hypothetical protein